MGWGEKGSSFFVRGFRLYKPFLLPLFFPLLPSVPHDCHDLLQFGSRASVKLRAHAALVRGIRSKVARLLAHFCLLLRSEAAFETRRQKSTEGEAGQHHRTLLVAELPTRGKTHAPPNSTRPRFCFLFFSRCSAPRPPLPPRWPVTVVEVRRRPNQQQRASALTSLLFFIRVASDKQSSRPGDSFRSSARHRRFAHERAIASLTRAR